MKKYDSEYKMRKNYESLVHELQTKIQDRRQSEVFEKKEGSTEIIIDQNENPMRRILENTILLNSPAETSDLTPNDKKNVKDIVINEFKDSQDENELLR